MRHNMFTRQFPANDTWTTTCVCGWISAGWPDRSTASAEGADHVVSAANERGSQDRWTDWLAEIGYGVNWADRKPPCTRRELAEAYDRADPHSGHTVEDWEWTIEQNTGASFRGDA